jgi:lysophospholipase L1-like esterase
MKVYVIGDSISIQYGPYLAQYLTGFMDYGRKEGVEEALLNLDKPQGANGGDSRMVLAYLQGKAKSSSIDADILLLNCGLHDIKTDPETGAKQVPLADYEANLRAIIELAASLPPALVWVRTTPCDEAIHNRQSSSFYRFAADGEAYNQVADRLMTEAGVPLLDLYGFTRNLGADLYCDHVHFHDHIREKQGAFIAGWLIAWSKGI